ncbi:hypothetical protein BKA82DRAFT_3933253, partial [Pisolithus tinctorius]
LSDPAFMRGHAAALLSFVQLLNEHSNILSPFSKLPVELLLEIFDNIANANDGSRFLMVCSHVCRVWRKVIVNSPRLWAHAMDFTGRSKDWVVTMLDRSTPHVFDIGWEYCFNLESDVRRITNHLCCAIRFLHRVHEVRLYVPPGSITGVMTCCPSSAPYLETIVLISSEDEGTDQVTELPAQIFELHAPHLR